MHSETISVNIINEGYIVDRKTDNTATRIQAPFRVKEIKYLEAPNARSIYVISKEGNINFFSRYINCPTCVDNSIAPITSYEFANLNLR